MHTEAIEIGFEILKNIIIKREEKRGEEKVHTVSSKV